MRKANMSTPKNDPAVLFARFETIKKGKIIKLQDSGTGCSVGINLQGHTCIKIKVDGCNGLTEIPGNKCDWCIKDCDSPGKYMFIELKGKRHKSADDAMRQIGNTITWFVENIYGFSLKNVNPKCYSIMRPGCPHDTPTIQNLKLRFKRKYKCEFIMRDKGFIIPLY